MSYSCSLRLFLSADLRTVFHTSGVARPCDVTRYIAIVDWSSLSNSVQSSATTSSFLAATKNPHFNGEVAYGDRAEHCWNGDPTRENAYSRLRYHQMYIPKGVERMLKTAPKGADLTSWRY